jgi:membrane protein insertase Oxa1/YidC/SpoIIIJ
MKFGGALWFPDLTSHDPYYVMPVVAAASMLATIEVFVLHLVQVSFCVTHLYFSISSVQKAWPKLKAPSLYFGECVVPFFSSHINFLLFVKCCLLYTKNLFIFVSLQGIFCYWVTSNLFSISQLALLRVPAVKSAFGIPEIVRFSFFISDFFLRLTFVLILNRRHLHPHRNFPAQVEVTGLPTFARHWLPLKRLLRSKTKTLPKMPQNPQKLPLPGDAASEEDKFSKI